MAVALVIAALFAPHVARGEDFDDAVSAYKRGDYASALPVFQWYAEQGDAAAQHNLGLMYDNGTGVLQDYREALRWYRKAVAQGYARSMANLGRMYGAGYGVPQDYVRAHMWSNLAAAAGAGDAIVQNRDLAAREMTPAQIAEAQRLARECLASNYKQCGEPAN